VLVNRKELGSGKKPVGQEVGGKERRGIRRLSQIAQSMGSEGKKGERGGCPMESEKKSRGENPDRKRREVRGWKSYSKKREAEIASGWEPPAQ